MVTLGPPAGPWELYATYLIFIPFILRVIILGRPVYRAVHHLAPHAGWAVKKVRQIEVKGFHYIILNEIFALVFPVALVIMVRLEFKSGVGWSNWSEVSTAGGLLLILALLLWITFDAIRLMPARRLFLLAGERDMKKVKLAIDSIFAARGALAWFSGSKSLAATASSDGQEDDEVLENALEGSDLDDESEIAETPSRSFKSTAKALLGQAAGKVLEVAKAGVQSMADKGKNLIDNQIKKQVNTLIEDMSKRKVPNLLRDIGMAVGPIIALWGIPHLIA